MATRALTAKAAVVYVVLAVATAAFAGQLLAGVDAVTAHALQALVRARQCECRGGMVEIPGFPVACAVAARALLAIAACVRIVFQVTTGALAVAISEQLCAMAVLTLDQSMTADQREAALVVLVGGLLPVFFGMAALAVLAQARLVDIVLGVAIDTGRAGLEGLHRLRVTALALGFPMSAEQGELGRLVVIEQAGFPVAGIVAVATLGAVAALVAVIFKVAIDAGLGGVGKVRRVGMASAASCFDVAAEQAERGARVIELGRRFPARAVVAGVAALVQRAAVLIVFAMTADAGIRCTFVLALDLMAAAALGVAVLAEQRIAGPGVIEARRLPVAFDVALGTVLAH